VIKSPSFNEEAYVNRKEVGSHRKHKVVCGSEITNYKPWRIKSVIVMGLPSSSDVKQ